MVQVKGYLYTALTLLMFTTIFTGAYYFYINALANSKTDIEAENTAYVFADVADDISAIVGLKVDVENGDELIYRFSDTMPGSENLSERLGNYTVFLENNVSKWVNMDLALNTTGFNEFMFSVYPVEYSWMYLDDLKHEIVLKNTSNSASLIQINLSCDLRGERIEDNIWIEAENMDGATNNVSYAEASNGIHVEDFTELRTTIDVPFDGNYSLWVRSWVDATKKIFTVTVGGMESMAFDLRDKDLPDGEYQWNNDTVNIFSLAAGENTVFVSPKPSSKTEAVDVIFLTTHNVPLDNVAPIEPPLDWFSWRIVSGSLDANIELGFDNANYSFSGTAISNTLPSWWNITFLDGDSIFLVLGGIYPVEPTKSSMYVKLDDSVNSSSVGINVSAKFAPVTGKAFVDSNITLRAGARKDEIRFALT